jgi:hypothetical protein
VKVPFRELSEGLGAALGGSTFAQGESAARGRAARTFVGGDVDGERRVASVSECLRWGCIRARESLTSSQRSSLAQLTPQQCTLGLTCRALIALMAILDFVEAESPFSIRPTAFENLCALLHALGMLPKASCAGILP